MHGHDIDAVTQLPYHTRGMQGLHIPCLLKREKKTLFGVIYTELTKTKNEKKAEKIKTARIVNVNRRYIHMSDMRQ